MNKRLVNSFTDMVKISSESGNECEFIKHLKNLFQRNFDADCTVDDYGNLFIQIASKNTDSKLPVLFSCHADTVKPGEHIGPVIRDGIIYSGGDTILGADDKAGIAELIEAIRTTESHPELEIVISVGEEMGLTGAKQFDVSVLRAKIGFVVDMDSLEMVVVGGPSCMAIDVEVTGKAAHAGLEPEKGISAIVAASIAIAGLRLGRIDDETTANVGIMEGGNIRNGVPATARVTAECRSLSHEKCVKLAESIKAEFENSARKIGARAEVTLTLQYKAVRIPESSESVQIAKKAIQSLGLTPNTRIIGGANDGQVFNDKGIETVAIGFGGKNPHGLEESIAVSDMEKAVDMLVNIFHQLCSLY
jgi:tripeptide aminopeptidase